MTLELVTEPHRTDPIDAEKSVLAAVLSGNAIAAEVLELLSESDFMQPAHAAVWATCQQVAMQGHRIDATTLPLPPRAKPHLVELITHSAEPLHAHRYAAVVRDAATRRRLRNATATIHQAIETYADADAAAEEARRAVDEAAAGGMDDDSGTSAAELLDATLEDLDKPEADAVLSGWPDLDEVVAMRPGHLVVVGARPATGKSVVAGNLARAACQVGVGVHFASLEMTRREVMQRMLADIAGVDLGRLTQRKLVDSDWERMSGKRQEIAKWPLWVDDSPSQTLMQIRSRARSTSRRHPVGLLIVDYLQLMGARDRRAPREQQVGENSEGLKALAKELNLVVVALAQVNRGPMDRRDPRPQMSDLRESGRIEQDADHIWLLHRPDLTTPDEPTGTLELSVAKQRHGPSGRMVELAFFGHYSRAASKAWSPTQAVKR